MQTSLAILILVKFLKYSDKQYLDKTITKWGFKIQTLVICINALKFRKKLIITRFSYYSLKQLMFLEIFYLK